MHANHEVYRLGCLGQRIGPGLFKVNDGAVQAWQVTAALLKDAGQFFDGGIRRRIGNEVAGQFGGYMAGGCRVGGKAVQQLFAFLLATRMDDGAKPGFVAGLMPAVDIPELAFLEGGGPAGQDPRGVGLI
jgi:hypothetical protein